MLDLYGAISSLWKGASKRAPWSNPLLITIGVGVAALGLHAIGAPNPTERIAACLLIGGSAATVGALLGFLFGIPRVMDNHAGQDGSSQTRGSRYQVNTNLEQISDWLTKIIVGLGLVQLGRIPSLFAELATYASSAFGEPARATSLTAALLLYFGVCGFLSAYLWTRILLTLEFTRADRAASDSPEFLEGYVHALLYQPAPDGFRLAIKGAEEFVQTFGESNWRIWRAVACAYGQKYRYLRAIVKPGEETDDQKQARQGALDAVRRVLALNPDEKGSLVTLWDPLRASPQEDDLCVFASDPEFRAIFEVQDVPESGKGVAIP